MYSNVLVALDGSQAAAAAIPHALEMARAFAARLILLRVLPIASGAEHPAGREYDAQRSQAEGYLDSLKRSLRNRGVKIESVIGCGDPASVILKTARSLGRPLVVITAYGRTPPQISSDFGRVALEVLKEAAGPVVFVRPPIDLHDQPTKEEVHA